jgi:hypothetical protein
MTTFTAGDERKDDLAGTLSEFEILASASARP